jgi:hypothetical protein
MHKASIWLGALLVMGLAPAAQAVLRAGPTPREILGSELLVKDYLEHLEVPAGRIHLLQEDLLAQAFPDYLFYVAAYPLPAEEIKITNDGNRARQGVGKLVVREGGSGTVEVALTLTPKCDPVKLVETVRLVPGKLGVVVPTAVQVVAAEKLVKAQLVEANLSVDPVRYIDDPVVVAAFPGRLLFVVPAAADPSVTEVDPGNLNVMVVAPTGKPQLLFGKSGQVGAIFNSVFGPAASDPRMREAIQVWARLQQVIHPGMKFGPIGAPQITTDEAGVKTVLSTTPVVGAGGKKWIFSLRLVFGKRGRLIAWFHGLKPV